MKKSFLIFMVLVFIFSSVYAGGAREAAPTRNVEFWSFWSPGTGREVMYNELKSAFEAENPDININFSFVGMDISQRLRPLFVSRDAPDIIENNDTEIKNFSKENLMRPLNDYLQGTDYTGQNTWADSFIFGSLESTQVDDSFYAIPMTVNVTGWFHDKNLFEKHGVQQPSTWDELISVMDTLKAAGVQPIGIDGNVDFYATWPFFNIAVRMAGIDKYLEALAGERSWNDPDFIAAANYFKQLVGYYEDGWRGQQYPGANAGFVQGRSAIMWVGSWIPGEVAEIAPPDFAFDFFPFPTLPDQKETRNIAEFKTNAWALPKDSRNNPDDAIQVLKYMTTVDSMEQFYKQDLSPSVIGAPQPEALARIPEVFEQVEEIMPFYCWTTEFEYRRFGADILRPALMDFAFGNIRTAEELVRIIDEQYRLMK